MIIQQFAKRVKDKREAIPATLDEIALFSGLSVEMLERVEAGKAKDINALEIERLAFALGATYSELMFGKRSA
jgi:transcriptional regulator with XRE-family HTH domain